ncbi:SpoIIE family protein phosphatase [bacterium]|nr:SpoIIE family protein phosphatase [bacterium]
MKAYTISSRLLSIGGFFLVMVIPILAPLWLNDRFLVDQEIAGIKELETRLDADLQLLMFDSQTREIFCRVFEDVFKELENPDFSKAMIKPESIAALHLLKAEGCFFNSKGEQKMFESTSLRSKYLIRELWKDLLDRAWDVDISDPRSLRYRSLFGPHFYVHDAPRLEGLPWEVTPKENGILIWRHFKKRAGLLLFIPAFPPPMETIAFALSSKSEGLWGVLDLSTRRFIWKGIPLPTWKFVFSRGVTLKGGTFLHNGFLCRVVQNPDGIWLFHALPMNSIETTKKRVFWWFAGFCFLLGFSFKWINSGTTPLSQLRLFPRLLVLVILAILVPCVLLVLLSISAFQERAAVLEQDLHENDLNRLRDADLLFMKRQKKMLALFRRIRDLPEIQTGLSSAVSRIERASKKRHFLARIETRRIDGSLLESVDKPGTTYDKMLALFAAQALKRYLDAPIPESVDSFSRLAVDFLLSPRLGFANVFDHPDSLNPIAIGREHIYWYWDIRKPTPEKPMAFFSVAQHRKWELEHFLRNDLPKGVMVFDGQMRRWAPKGALKNRLLDLLAAQALLGNQSSKQKLLLENTPFLATAFPSGVVKNLCFLTLSNLSPVNEKISRLRNLFLFGFFLFGILVFSFSGIISKVLLSPISEISKGIDALEKRKLSFRIPDLGINEFGKLAFAFNNIMGDLQDLDMAREVQSNLIPQKPSELNEYEVKLINLSASDLGGDYCDSILTQDGKLLLIMGDVSGHGISSALLMAMAKTICFISAKEGVGIPTLFGRLNRLIQKGIKKKKLMTMVVGILDGETHTLEWSNSGHNYPIMRKADGSTLELKMPQFPLGSKRNPSWKVERLSIDPGDCLVFYTDGIIEALDSNEELFGYERFSKAISGIIINTVVPALQLMMSLF